MYILFDNEDFPAITSMYRVDYPLFSFETYLQSIATNLTIFNYHIFDYIYISPSY